MNLKGMEHFFKVFDMLGSTGTYGYDGTENIKPLPLIAVDIAHLGRSGALKTDHDLTIKDVCYAEPPRGTYRKARMLAVREPSRAG